MRDWLQKARLEKDMTQQQIAEKLGISESYYSYIENGDRQKKMDLSLASRLSAILDIPVQRIVESEGG